MLRHPIIFSADDFSRIFSMLQVMKHQAVNTISVKKLAGRKDFYSAFRYKPPDAVICERCMYVNDIDHHFCTNCGYPVSGNESDLKLYRLRSKQRGDLLKHLRAYVLRARVMLYVSSTFFLASVGFLFSKAAGKYSLAFGGVILSGLFFLLARWSIQKPFTAMLTAFIIVLTFCTIIIFGELVNSFSTVQGLYSIVTSMIMIYFLLKGVQAAYKSDLLKEEMEVY